MNYDPLVEYYRDRLTNRRPTIPGWRRFYGPLGVGYQQDGTGFVLDAAMAEHLHAEGRI